MITSYPSELRERARSLRKNQTEAERILWKELRNRNFFGYKFVRQKPLSTFIADFYCSELRLIIEVDGDYHDQKQQMECDKVRTSELQAFMKRVIRYTNNEVLFHLQDVLDDLKKRIDGLI